VTWIDRFRAVLLDRRGAVAIEFAAIALPLMLLLVGSIEASRYIWTSLALQDAASTGARCLGLQLAPCFDNENMDQAATVGFVKEQALRWAIDIPSETVTPAATAECQEFDDFTRIEIRHQFTSILPVFPNTWIEVEACFPVSPSE